MSQDQSSKTTARKRVRTALADRMGFAWEAEELPDMTAAEAREILERDAFDRDMGGIGNEDSATLAHARMLVAEATGNG